MKWLLKVVDAVRPTFEEGGKLHVFNPVFGAIEHFLFAPGNRTLGAPHIRDAIDLKRFMSMAIISVVPCAFAALYFFGWRFLAMVVVSYLFFQLKPEEKLAKWSLVMIMAGAVGNTVDRVRFGYVVDFIDLYVGQWHWPAFNVADSVITIGAILYLIDIIRSKGSQVKPQPK